MRAVYEVKAVTASRHVSLLEPMVGNLLEFLAKFFFDQRPDSWVLDVCDMLENLS